MELFLSKRVPRDIVPKGVLQPGDINVELLAYYWSLVQTDLESLLQKTLRLSYRPQLFLVHKVVDHRTGEFRFILPRPTDDRVMQVLMETLGLSEESFDVRVRLVGERLRIQSADIKSEYLLGGEPNLGRIHQAITNLLQTSDDLKQLARKVNGAIKPIRIANEISYHGMIVRTEWQDIVHEQHFRLYWRIDVQLERLPLGDWDLVTLIDFGERLSSQSPSQIFKIADTNNLGVFDVNRRHELPGGGSINIVTYNPITLAGERVLDSEFAETIGEMAPLLWNSVKNKVLIRMKTQQ